IKGSESGKPIRVDGHGGMIRRSCRMICREPNAGGFDDATKLIPLWSHLDHAGTRWDGARSELGPAKVHQDSTWSSQFLFGLPRPINDLCPLHRRIVSAIDADAVHARLHQVVNKRWTIPRLTGDGNHDAYVTVGRFGSEQIDRMS